MIKKLLTLTALGLLTAASMQAVPALPFPQRIAQPDGSFVTLTQHGDEWFNYATTRDGYTVVQATDGSYVYAQLSADGQQLVPTTVVAHDPEARSAADAEFLQQLGTGQLPEASVIESRMKAGRTGAYHLSGKLDVSNFRGLVILVNYSDRTFQQPDVFGDMLNKEGYTGYTDAVTGQWVECTGSVHDYFKDNSNGNFAPQFDVYGPVTVNYHQAYPQQASYAQPVFKAALKQLDSVIDYSKYDTNGDGVVDMVFFICPGGGSNAGNNSSYLWPHASTFSGVSYDGVSFGRYACSTELYGLEKNKVIDGIGTITHEFSHVLGYADHYDVNYYTNGLSSHPGKWDVMASGCYLNKSRTPSGLSLYERHVMDWAVPTVVSSRGVKRVLPLQTANSGYRINSAVSDEYFLIENRKAVRWDAYLPGEGLLVWRVDSTDESVWTGNKINANPTHNYLEVVRASEHDTTYYYSNKQYTVAIDGTWDAFPGTDGVDTLLNADTAPSLSSWTGLKSEWTMRNITQRGDYCTFNAVQDPINFYYEPFENMPLTSADTTGVQGAFAQWTLTGGARVCQPDSGWADGRQAVGLIKNSEAYFTDAVQQDITTIGVKFSNPTSSTAILRCYVSTDAGATWQGVNTFSGGSYLMLKSGATTDGEFYAGTTKPALVKFKLFSGSSSAMTYIDDVKVNYDAPSAPVTLLGDLNGDGQIDTTDVALLINCILGTETLDQADTDLNGDGQVDAADVTELINIILAQ